MILNVINFWPCEGGGKAHGRGLSVGSIVHDTEGFVSWLFRRA